MAAVAAVSNDIAVVMPRRQRQHPRSSRWMAGYASMLMAVVLALLVSPARAQVVSVTQPK